METIGVMLRYLSLLNVPHTKKYVKKRLSSIADGDSMFGLSALLSEYGVENHCLKMGDEDFNRLENPFITLIEGQFAIVEKKGNSRLSLTFNNGKKQIINNDEFKKLWNYSALIGIATSDSKEPDYKIHRSEERIKRFLNISAVISILTFIGFGIISDPSGGFLRLVLLGLSMAGVFITFLLLQKDLDIPNKVTSRICGLVKENDCSDITQSSAAKLLGILHLSEIGGAYFLTNTVALILTPDAIPFIVLTSVLSLPFIVWSISYQKFKLHGWCALCLITASILACQTIFSFITLASLNYDFTSISTGCMMASVYVIMTLGINMCMKYFGKSMMLPQCESAYYGLKGKRFVTEGYRHLTKIHDVSEENCSMIILGNPLAKNRLTIISNPYCHPCSMLHEHIFSWPGEDLAVQCVFTAFSEEKEIINRAIIASYLQFGNIQTWKLLSEWFRSDKKDGIDFFKKYRLDLGNERVDAEIMKHRGWCDRNEVTGTPTVLINGMEINSPFTIDDYHFFKQ